MNGGLRTALVITGIWGVVAGILLLFPSLGAAVFGRDAIDPAVVSGWGSTTLVFGLLALAAAADTQKYGGLAWLFSLGLLLGAVTLAYYWYTGDYTARTALVPLVIDLVLAGWIWSAKPEESARLSLSTRA